MHYVTTFLDPNEPCEAVSEGPRLWPMPDGSTEWRWIQQVFVIRDDTISKFETDIGPASDYHDVPPVAIYSGLTDNVATIQDMAARHRHDDYWVKRAAEMKAESTFTRDHIDQWEQRHEAIHNRSQMGPVQNFQRNGYSRTANQRRLKEIIREKTGRIQI